MDANVVTTLIGVGGTLGGIILGFWLSQRATREQDLIREVREVASVRLLLTTEMRRNLANLKVYLRVMFDEYDKGKATDVERFNHALAVAATPLPIWSSRMWERQTSSVAFALSPQELREVDSFHGLLDTVSSLYYNLTQTVKDLTRDLAQLHRQGRILDGSRRVLSMSDAEDETEERYAPRLIELCDWLENTLRKAMSIDVLVRDLDGMDDASPPASPSPDAMLPTSVVEPVVRGGSEGQVDEGHR